MGCWWLRLANYGVGAGLLAARATHHPGFMMPQAEQHFGLELQLLSDITQFHGDGLGASIAHVSDCQNLLLQARLLMICGGSYRFARVLAKPGIPRLNYN